ncbi:uncharacterized protein J3D65DRAFT_623178 [Phyllosticta citribraziliensis]|uniref:Secreted protein n=1 Tax=Phyllosticta citribraziliensis TaxID=989973 RepID=A0ABR1LVP5_9PEZI
MACQRLALSAGVLRWLEASYVTRVSEPTQQRRPSPTTHYHHRLVSTTAFPAQWLPAPRVVMLVRGEGGLW